MKFGMFNIWVNFHRHKWEWHYDAYHTMSYGHEIKVYQKCVAPDCKYGGYKSVCWLQFRTKPDLIGLK